VKPDTLLELQGNIPTFAEITDGKTADATQLHALVIEPGALYVFGRGFTEVGRLYAITEALAFFVIRGRRGSPMSGASPCRSTRPVESRTIRPSCSVAPRQPWCNAFR
jgi:hypothetical protein